MNRLLGIIVIALAKVNNFKPGRIRMMNWMAGNTHNFTKFAYRKPKDYICWSSTFIPSIDVGLTTNSNGDYSVGSTGRGALQHGEMLHVRLNIPNPYTQIACTISNASPGVFTSTGGAHGLSADMLVGAGATTTASPNFNNSQGYYVLSSGLTSNTFQLSKTKGGSPVSNVGDAVSSGIYVIRQPTFSRDGLPPSRIISEIGTIFDTSNGPGGISGDTRIYVSTLNYDASIDAWFLNGNGRWDLGYSGDSGILDGAVPFEWMLDLCATVGADIMLSGYVTGTYPSTGLHKEIAQFCKNWIAANNVPWMKVAQEGNNENWNWPLFGLTTTARYVAKYKLLTGTQTIDYHNPYGWAMTEIGQEYSQVFGGDTTKYDVICGVQTSGAPANFNSRMNSDQWMAQGSVPTGYVLQPAKNFITEICCAQYISSPLSGNSTEIAMQTAYTSGDASQVGLYLDSYSGSSSATFCLQYVLAAHQGWKTWAVSFGVRKMCGYEGGYSPDYSTTDTTYTLRRDAKQYTVPSANFPGGIYGVLQGNIDNFFSLNDGSFVAHYPSVFDFEGPYPSTNAWSIQEDIYQPNSEQLKCYALIGNKKRRYIAKAH